MKDPMREIMDRIAPPPPGLDDHDGDEVDATNPRADAPSVKTPPVEDDAEITEQALDEAEENIEPEDERDGETNLGVFYERDYADRIAGWEFKIEDVYVKTSGEYREIEVYYRRPLGSPSGTTWERIGHARSPDALVLRRLIRCAELRDERAENGRRRRALIEGMFGAGSVPLVESLIAAGRSAAAEPAPLTPRQDAFCRHYLTEPSGTRAAIKAGYAESGADVQSSRLLGNARVLQKISELRRAHALSYALDRDTMLDKLEAFFDDAMQGQSFSAALRALLAQAELSGLLTRRHKATERAEARVRAAPPRTERPKRPPAPKKTGARKP